MPHLNYHHLRYFWIIATEGSMSRAAQRLNVSPSSLSVQIKALEEQLGQQLFERVGRTLQLTEAGRIAVDYAGSVFKSGHELMETLSGLRPGRQVLRVGAAATLSRNFQIAFLRPLIGRIDVELIIHTGLFDDLLEALDAHKLDIVLANHPASPDARSSFENTLIDEQGVSIVSHKPAKPTRLGFPQDLARLPIVLPGRGNALRSAFDALLGRSGIRPVIAAEVDDMAMLRLMARESGGLALVPPIVVIDELRSGLLVERIRLNTLKEQFFAVTQQRRYPNPLVAELIRSPSASRIRRMRGTEPVRSVKSSRGRSSP
ncbi:LysR family transcriptional regulator [Bradyrhizobium sp. WYCCWR 13023]|uniref:LysR family transcriptional regulator n=1 Tax=Bradyrhizobium zhengyangense TaxID=2911009 RepID=A0A9X1R867_9BRAD|nr:MULTISPECIES: LysR family transcriptional regulator [Bradyrhizobium]MCG2626303.1 LysR family transcriptional regulator [Bradyrhizobium zhengyangense]MCG2645667.1 LysR family transcriptional regulator [Bradyrhizobium zhengyangense]MCG2668311.1 LysR family transcriptional regulator [Bradyrhizobium zhengyangense]MDA9521283.1 LysR family transcriptional regulator [Bradyrhizobium sp. CCBAU 11434]